MVRLSQPWIMRYPLIDFHGNQGSINGDGPAAYRYTEARLSKFCEDGMLQGLKKRNVDFIPSYDESTDEPVTLPAIFPNLLCNPNTGIGVAMACNWLPHNLGEVANAIYDYMDEKEPTLPGPDFPTGGIIINKDDIPGIMKTGHGSVKVRGRYKIEKQNIVFYEIPYNTTIEALLAEIGALCDKKEIEGITELRDETNKKSIRIVVSCAKGVNPDGVAQKLYAKTNLQTSISYNQVALIDKTPTELNLKDAIKIYVEHNIQCLIKELTFDLNKAKDRLHIIEGLLICLEDIDNVIALIKKSSDSSAARIALMAKYGLDEVQAKAVLAMRLSSLAHMEKIELENEKKELVDKINDINDILSKNERQKEIIKNRLSEIVKKYGDARRTELTQITVSKEDKEIVNVEPEKCVVVMTESGLVKRIPITSFRTQKRNGKGVKTQDDITNMVIRTNTIDNLMIFTNKGKMYRLLVDNIPVGTNVSQGVSLHNLIQMEDNEKPTVMYSIYRDTDAKFVLFITKNGLVKKTSLEEYLKTRKKTGMAAISLREGDSLAAVTLVKDEDLVILTENGMGIRIKSTDIGATGRNTSGVKGITLKEGDSVITGLVVRDKNDSLALFSTIGNGKKINLDDLPTQGRAGKGLTVSKDQLADAALVSDEDSVLIVGNKNSLCISAKEIPLTTRVALGNIVIKGSRVISVSKV